MSESVRTEDEDVVAERPQAAETVVTALAAHVRAGGLAILPTDTVYGIGSLASDAAAVARVLAAKGRGRQMPPPVLVADPTQVDALVAAVPPAARALMDAFWPGALTLILDAAPDLGWDLGETGGTLALRMPGHPLALALLAATGPMAVTSANHTGEPPATDAASGAAAFPGRVTVVPAAFMSSDAAARPGTTTSPQPGLAPASPGVVTSPSQPRACADRHAQWVEVSGGVGQGADRVRPDILLLDGGPTPGPVPSTIVTLAGRHAGAPAVLRDGVLSHAALAAVLEPLRACVPGLDLSGLADHPGTADHPDQPGPHQERAA